MGKGTAYPRHQNQHQPTIISFQKYAAKRNRNTILFVIALFILSFLTPLLYHHQLRAFQSTPEPSPTVTLTPTPLPTQTPENPVLNTAIVEQAALLKRWQAHVQAVSSLSFSPDQIHLVSTGDDSLNGTSPIQLWNLQTLEPVAIDFEGIQPFASAQMVRFSEDGSHILGMVTVTGTAIWNTTDGARVARIGDAGLEANFAKLLTSDYRVVIVRDSGLISIWTVPVVQFTNSPEEQAMGMTEEIIEEYNHERLDTAFQLGKAVSAATFSPDLESIFLVTSDGALSLVRIGDYRFRTLLSTIQKLELNITPSDSSGRFQIALKPNSNILAIASPSGEVVLWDYVTETALAHYTLNAPSSCLLFSPQADLLFIGEQGVDSSLHILDATTGALLRSINTETSVASCAFNPFGTLFATGSYEGEISLWGVP